MKILDKLKNIFEAKFSDVLNNNKFVLFDFSRNETHTIEAKKDNKLSIDLTKANGIERKRLKEEIIDVEFAEVGSLLSDESRNKTKLLKDHLPIDDDKETLKFYKDKLKPNMYKALELALTIRNAFKDGENVSELKRDIATQYPDFGNNLSNLATGDYFHKHFIELYNSMIEDEEFDILIYQKKVEKIVKSLPYIVFITQFKKYTELSGQVKFKLDKLKKYGTGKLVLHGIGPKNVATTLKILEEYKDDDSIIIDKDINPNKTIITATLKF